MKFGRGQDVENETAHSLPDWMFGVWLAGIDDLFPSLPNEPRVPSAISKSLPLKRVNSQHSCCIVNYWNSLQVLRLETWMDLATYSLQFKTANNLAGSLWVSQNSAVIRGSNDVLGYSSTGIAAKWMRTDPLFQCKIYPPPLQQLRPELREHLSAYIVCAMCSIHSSVEQRYTVHTTQTSHREGYVCSSGSGTDRR